MRAIRPLAVLVILSLPACGGGNAPDASASEAPEGGAAAPAASQPASGGATRRGPNAAPAAEAPAARVVAAGTTLTFTMNEEVSTSDHKAGHTFTTALASDALGADGAVVVPSGAIGHWVVTESTDDNGQGEAVLAVKLESIEVGGTSHPVTATVTDAELSTDKRDSKTETAAKIGIGAAAGAIAGKVLGGSTSATLKGAGAGAAVGTAIALTTRGGSASLKQGAKVTVTLDAPLTLAPG